MSETVFDRLDQEGTSVVVEREPRKLHVCDQCGREFESAQGLGAHQASHLAKKELCAHCGQSFMSGAGMGRHLSTAHGVNNGKSLYRNQRRDCPECNKSVRAKDLARHLRDVHKKGPAAKPRNQEARKATLPEPLTAEQITRTAAQMLWPEGIPHDKLDALMMWHQETVEFLSQV